MYIMTSKVPCHRRFPASRNSEGVIKPKCSEQAWIDHTYRKDPATLPESQNKNPALLTCSKKLQVADGDFPQTVHQRFPDRFGTVAVVLWLCLAVGEPKSKTTK